MNVINDIAAMNRATFAAAALERFRGGVALLRLAATPGAGAERDELDRLAQLLCEDAGEAAAQLEAIPCNDAADAMVVASGLAELFLSAVKGNAKVSERQLDALAVALGEFRRVADQRFTKTARAVA
jgi:hypothetical protein